MLVGEAFKLVLCLAGRLLQSWAAGPGWAARRLVDEASVLLVMTSGLLFSPSSPPTPEQKDCTIIVVRASEGSKL